MREMEIKIMGYAVVEKTVTAVGNTAHVTVPRAWLGKRVKAILLDPVDGDE